MADEQQDPHEYDVFAPTPERSQKFLQCASTEGVVRINLNRPPANVLSIDMMDELNGVCLLYTSDAADE